MNQYKNLKRYGILAGLLVFALIVAGVLGAFQPAKPAQSESIIGYQNVLLFNGIGYTTTQTSTLQDTRYYGTADCYFNYDSTSAASSWTTPTIQHSADGSVWVNGLGLTGLGASGTSFTRTILYGQFTRVVMAVANTNAVTATVRCALKNAQQ